MTKLMEWALGLTTLRCILFGHRWEYRTDRCEYLCSRCLIKVDEQ